MHYQSWGRGPGLLPLGSSPLLGTGLESGPGLHANEPHPGMWGSGRLSAATCWPLAVAGVGALPACPLGLSVSFTDVHRPYTEPHEEKAHPFSLRLPGSLWDSISAGCLCPNVSPLPWSPLSLFLNPHLRICSLTLERGEGGERGTSVWERNTDRLPPVLAPTGPDRTGTCHFSGHWTVLQASEPPSQGWSSHFGQGGRRLPTQSLR